MGNKARLRQHCQMPVQGPGSVPSYRAGKGLHAILLTLGICVFSTAFAAEDELPALDFSRKPSPSGSPDYGLLIEGSDDQPGAGKSARGLLVPGRASQDQILYEDEHHRVLGNPSRPFVQMMYRMDPESNDWMFDGNVVRGHVARGSKFGWTVAVSKPYMAIMDWSAKPNVAAIIVYEKTPKSVRGWKKKYEVVADDPSQARCMGGLEAQKWLAKWKENQGEDCGVRTIDGSKATQQSIDRQQRH